MVNAPIVNKLYCPFRRKYVAALPEEQVRQAFLRGLTEKLSYPKSLIGVEVPIQVGAGIEKRCDAVVYSPKLQPLMLLEFKAPNVPLTQTVLDQAAIYNTTLHAAYIVLANDVQTVVAHITPDNQIEFLNNIPAWSQLLP